MFICRAFSVWLLIVFVESVHGLLRQLLLEPRVGDFMARQVSVLIGAALIVAITFLFVRWIKASGTLEFFLIGAMWVVMTVGFEILLGRLVMGLSWERIASDYDIGAGGLMGTGLFIMFLAPLMMAKLRDEI